MGAGRQQATPRAETRDYAEDSPELVVASTPDVRLTHRIGLSKEDLMRISRTYVLVVCFALAVPVFAASNNKGENPAATVSLAGFQAVAGPAIAFGSPDRHRRHHHTGRLQRPGQALE